MTEGADINELIRKYGLNVKDAEDKEFIMPDSINFCRVPRRKYPDIEKAAGGFRTEKRTFARGIRRLQGVGRFVLP